MIFVLYSLCFTAALLSHLGNSAYVDTKYLMDGSGLSPGNTDHSACVMAPPTKRSKLYAFSILVMLHLVRIFIICLSLSN